MAVLSNTLKLLLCACLLSACSTAPVMYQGNDPPRSVPWRQLQNEHRPVVALALGSGGARGFAHVGVLKVLHENGIEADMVVGTSAGSVVGAFYAGGIRGQALMAAARDLDSWALTDFGLPDRGVIVGIELQRYVNRLLGGRLIEELNTPFIAVATRLETGEAVLFNSGDPGMAVRASSAVPGVVRPVLIQGREYVDGGLVSQVPVRISRRLGAELVIAVDVSRHPLLEEQVQSSLGVMQQSFIIMANRIADSEIEEADIVIRPKVGAIASNQFDAREQALAAGEAAARAALPQIEQRLAAMTKMKQGK